MAVKRGALTADPIADRIGALLRSHPRWRLIGDQVAIPCVFMRGGTSRGAILRADDVPGDPRLRERVIAAIYGSPDARQIDGIGGADPLTSKVAIVGPATHPDADVDFTFGQVRIDEPIVDFDGNCGNMSAAIGPFAVDEGMVDAVEPVTRVRIHLTNTGQRLLSEVPVRHGRALVEGDAEVPGVPGRGAPVLLDLGDTAGTLGGGVLPTGAATDRLALGDGSVVTATIVDAGNATVFVSAADVPIGFGASALTLSTETLSRLAAIRGAAAVRLGLVTSPEDAAGRTPAVPKMYWVGPPTAYVAAGGRTVRPGEMSLAAAGLSMGHPHQAYATTVAVATAVAAMVPGSVVHGACDPHAVASGTIRIGHPSGVMAVAARARVGADGVPVLTRVAIQRTARRIMDGHVYVPLRTFDAAP